MTTKQTSNTNTPLPGTIALFKESWTIYKNNFKHWLPIYGFFVIDTELNNLFNYLQQIHVISAPVMILGNLFSNIIFIYASILLVFALKNKTKHINLRDKNAFTIIWPFFLLNALYVLIVLGGLVLLIIPGFIWGTWYAFANIVLLTENLGIKASLAKSKYYVKNHFRAVLRRLLLFTLITTLVSVIIYGLIQFIIHPLVLAKSIPHYTMYIINALLSVPSAGFLTVLGTIYSFQLYTHLKSIASKSTSTKKA